MQGFARRLRAVLPMVIALVAVLVIGVGSAWAESKKEREREQAGEESAELLQNIAQFMVPRSAPYENAPGGAYEAAKQYAESLPATSGSWDELGPYSYAPDDHRYVDPVWSNSGSGSGFNTGRITALALGPDGVLYAGGAGGGVWRAADPAHQQWEPTFDDELTTAIGALAVSPKRPDGSYTVYAGTGEANFNQDAYAGVGVLASDDRGGSWHRLGGDELVGATIYRIVDDGTYVLAATNHGLYRYVDGAWKRVLGSDDKGSADGGLDNVQVINSITDVAIKPDGSHKIVALRGWRQGAATNGLYTSADGGDTWKGPLNPQGYVSGSNQGRGTLAYSADGRKLYVMVQSPVKFNSPGAHSMVQGVYLSKDDTKGPFTMIAGASTFMNSGSAMKPGDIGHGYQPGIQAWYNQFLVVDPTNADHVYAGLEEVYETKDAGHTWVAAAPYWNLTLDCFDLGQADFGCPSTTHSDQHAALVDPVAKTVYVGNDGGVFSRATSFSSAGDGWKDHNERLGTLQYYYASSGQPKAGGPTQYWGGLQDNGTSKLRPGASLFAPDEASQPFGGDGGDTLVAEHDADKVVTEYVNLDMAATTNGGQTWKEIAPGDPSPLFIAPFAADRKTGVTGDLYAGGEFLWKATNVFADGPVSWTQVADTGAGHSITAIDVHDGKGIAAFCGPCQPGYTSETGFGRGLVVNTGAGWTKLDLTSDASKQGQNYLPPRYIGGVAYDDAHSTSAADRTFYVALGGYVRHWFLGPIDTGTGHVYRSQDGGKTWQDVSGAADAAGHLPDAPADDVLVVGDKLVVATDAGVFSSGLAGGTWTRVGTSLPNTIVTDLSLTPDGDILAATHGRGLWKIAPSAL